MAENGAHFSGEGHLIEAQIEGDVNKTIRPVVCDADGHLIVDVDASTITIGTVDIRDSFGNPITATGGNLNVEFTSPQAVTEANVDKNFGAWSYYAGVSGTVVVAGGQRVLGIGCHSDEGGSFTINGGAVVPIPEGISINVEPLANLISPTIIFTGTDSYFIEVVS